jgi:hypothetical protein
MWKSAPLPGEAKASQFLPPLESYVYVEASDGRIFRQDLTSYQNLSWTESTAPMASQEDRADFPLDECRRVAIGEGDHPQLRPPRGTVEQLNCIHLIHPEYYIRYRYVILSNGGIRRWAHESPTFGNFLIYALFMVFGGIGGGMGGVMIFKTISSLRERSVEDRTLPMTEYFSF